MNKPMKKKSFLARLFSCTRGEVGPLGYAAMAGLGLTIAAGTMALANNGAKGAARDMGARLGAAGGGSIAGAGAQ